MNNIYITFVWYSSLKEEDDYFSMLKMKTVYIEKWRHGLQEMTGGESGLKFTHRETAASAYHKFYFQLVLTIASIWILKI